MNQKYSFEEIFNNAKWIMAEDIETYGVFRKNFQIDEDIKSATIDIIGLGTFVFYINGVPGCDHLFLPLNSDYEERKFPSDECFNHRIYVSKYDITHLIKKGKNTLCTLLGKGWYNGNYSDIKYGDMKLCYIITLTTEKETKYIVSDLTDKYAPSYIKNVVFYRGEEQDYTDWDKNCLNTDFDDTNWKNVTEAPKPETEYLYSDCPKDKVIQEITPEIVSRNNNTVIYDAKSNISGYPVIKTEKGCNIVKVTFSEELTDGMLNEKHSHKQFFTINADGKELITHPVFAYMGFRYICVEGKATVLNVQKIHSDVEISSEFECSDETLNWIYNTYINTQLCNMHQGIPSDCPHIERRGYTGDGQITCRSAMRCLDMKDFYYKWIDDISDCQDKLTGHVQYTAPYTHSGGGPGGWGGAIVILPYEYFKYYGDDSKIRAMYPQMLKYFEYMEAHSENNLVTSDKPGCWCLGEWCTPGPVVLPAPFVNTYYYIKTMEMAVEIAEYLGKTDDIPLLKERIESKKNTLKSVYFNSWDSNFFGMVQGANAFMLDIGIGDERTKKNFIEYYEKLGYYDTGIFGIDVVTRLLFEYGRGDIAYKLLTADTPHGFGRWKNEGATTFREYWGTSRSHSHPMFGSVVAYLFEHILGIKYHTDWSNQPKTEISPANIPDIKWAKGSITTPYGKISVSYTNNDGEMNVKSNIV